jgi:hypothetical protein
MYPAYESPKFDYAIMNGHIGAQSDDINFKLTSGDILEILEKIKKDDLWLSMVNSFLTISNDTEVGKLTCPFPIVCSKWDHCVDTYCNADCCENGYAYRMS